MVIVKLATLALGLAVAATASTSFAQSDRASTNRARAIQESDRASTNRAQAIQDCNAAAGKYSEHLWGSVSRQMYRTCMADRGEKE
jgi:hypothetical protein